MGVLGGCVARKAGAQPDREEADVKGRGAIESLSRHGTTPSGSGSMTAKQRMLAAYRGELPDAVPVAPEFWYYVPAKLLGVDMVTFEREVPLWEALQQTFRHYGTEGWGIVSPSVPTPGVSAREEWVELGEGRFESRVVTQTPHGTLARRHRYDRDEPSWPVERAIKDFLLTRGGARRALLRLHRHRP